MLNGITTAICRPPRAQYSVADLGPPRVRYRGVEYKREDFSVRNSRGFAVKGSVWELINPRLGDSESCILYLHPNSGSRVDVVKTRIMSIAASAKCTVCGFDFTGCGSSEGDNVSLGVREKEDICVVLSYLLSRGCKRFVLWGRSMGAASAAMFLGAYKEALRGAVVALVLDSPFTSMQGLAAEYTSSTKVPVPNLLLSPALHVLRQNILSMHGFDIHHISPIAAASRITVPTVVLSGSDDKIVPPALSQSIYEALNGPKLRLFFSGGHNTHRPSVVFDAIRVVLTGALRGLHAKEFLPLSEAVINNYTSPPVSRLTPSPNNPSEKFEHTNTPKESVSDVEAKKSASEQERLVSNYIQEKSIEALTDKDVKQALGEGVSPCSKPTTERLETKSTHNNLDATTLKTHENKKNQSSFCRVELDICEDINEYGGMSSGSSWSESISHFFWGRDRDISAPPPPGSFGHLRQQLAHDVCPPEELAWEELLLAHASSLAIDAVIDQIFTIVTGFEVARLGSRDRLFDMRDDHNEALLMSMLVAEVTADVGVVSVQGDETSCWGRLLLLSMSELLDVSRKGEDNTTDTLKNGCPDDNSVTNRPTN